MTNIFKIRYRGGISLGLLSAATFDIYDVKRNQSGMYELRGIGVDIKSTPASQTNVGKFTTFTTPVDMTASDFGGPVKFISSGAFEQSFFRLGLEPAGCPPFEVSVDTGFTWGFSVISLNAGIFMLIASYDGPPVEATPISPIN
jgi:hypothetical protein